MSHRVLASIVPGKREAISCGLITNQSGVTSAGVRSIDYIAQLPNVTLKYIFAPEHGLQGVLAEKDVHDSVDEKTSIPIISLYGNGSGRMIAPELLDGLDIMLFDIQDSGMRHYTYISTLLQCMKVAAESNTFFVVLDRPNPLGGLMCGPLVDDGLFSFISIAPLPLRHGMTVGEVALYFNNYILEKPARLSVIKMKHYNGDDSDFQNISMNLSPNIQTLESCQGYSFLGLLGEIKPFFVGIGTPLSFQVIALPKTVAYPEGFWQKVNTLFARYGIVGHDYAYVKEETGLGYKGLRLEFSSIGSCDTFALLLDLCEFFKQQSIQLTFSPSFDKAVGTKLFKEVINGAYSRKLFINKVMNDLEKFQNRVRSVFLYHKYPFIRMV